MDRIDKLISKKISQMEQPNADAAWNDFVQFRESKFVAPQKTAWYFSKTALSVLAVLLLSVGAIGGFQFALMNSEPAIISANSTTNSKDAIKESGVQGLTVNQPVGQQEVAEKKQNAEPKSNQKIFGKPLAQNVMENKPLVTNIPIKSTTNGKTTLLSEMNIQGENTPKYESGQFVESSNTKIASSVVVVDENTETTLPVLATVNEDQKTIDSAMPANEMMLKAKAEEPQAAKEESEISPNETINDNPPTVKTSGTTSYTTNYAPSAYSEIGAARKGKRMSMKSYLSVFNRYTDMSFYSLENSNDLTTALNGKFTSNPANSGIDNRYSILLGTKSEFIQSPSHSFDMQSRDSYIGNSFTLLNNKVGVGLAVQNISMDKMSALNINMSSAYKIVLAKNAQLRLGFGFSSSSISIVNPDAPKSDISAFSFHLGARYMYKTIYAQVAMNNFVPIMVRNDASNYTVPTNLQMSVGGRLYLSKTWAFHPQLSMNASADKNFNFGFTSSFSCQNKWLMGLQTNDFKSIGLHAGVYANRRIAIILKTDLYHSSQSTNSLMETGEVMLKFELGRFKR